MLTSSDTTCFLKNYTLSKLLAKTGKSIWNCSTSTTTEHLSFTDVDAVAVLVGVLYTYLVCWLQNSVRIQFSFIKR
jgi:outer membrane protein assembly factor BamB